MIAIFVATKPFVNHKNIAMKNWKKEFQIFGSGLRLMRQSISLTSSLDNISIGDKLRKLQRNHFWFDLSYMSWWLVRKNHILGAKLRSKFGWLKVWQIMRNFSYFWTLHSIILQFFLINFILILPLTYFAAFSLFLQMINSKIYYSTMKSHSEKIRKKKKSNKRHLHDSAAASKENWRIICY